MKEKGKIKIIRKKDVAAKENAVEDKTEDVSGKSARKMVTNVSSWVNDLQKRKRAETKVAIDKLFPASPQTDSA